MNFDITSLLLFIMILLWQLIMWKKIKLQKWQDYSLSATMVGLSGWLVYLAFLS
tara:strand:- start:1626 stop:1787 length:162 start_codon:yes stop_codon:yes gene_type:complete